MRVRDESRAVLPAATVVAANTATGVVLHATTNEIGFFVIPGVQPGAYRPTVEYAGMQRSWTFRTSLPW